MKLKKNQLLFVIFVGLLALIVGASVLLHHNFNFIGKYDDGSQYANAVFVSGSYAYVADAENGLEIIDISDPTTPVKVGQFDEHGEYLFDVFISGSYAYVADMDDGLEIIDISDPTTPVKVGQVDNASWANGVYVSGSYAYVANGLDGLMIIDISDPTTPVNVSHFDDGGSGSEVYVSGSYAYLADSYDGLEIFDISDPNNPVEVGQFEDGRSAYNVYVSGSYAYLTDELGCLKIIDISDPTTPVEVGQFEDGGLGVDVYVSGSYAYLADMEDGLEIIDISDPTTPVEVGQFDDGGSLRCVFVSGLYAYVFDGDDGLEIIDPWSPKEKTSNIILWSIIGILSLLVLADIGYLIKEEKPTRQKTIQEKIKSKEPPLDGKKKQVLDFGLGFFLIIGESLVVFIPLNISLIFHADQVEIPIGIIFVLIILPIFIIIDIVLFVRFFKKNRYSLMGMITAIFGPLFLFINRNGEQIVDPYMEHPKKKKISHFSIGFLLSIGLVILHTPVLLFGYVVGAMFIVELLEYGFGAMVWFLVVISIIVLNIIIGVLLFFFKEKLRYISMGMITSLLIIILLGGITI